MKRLLLLGLMIASAACASQILLSPSDVVGYLGQYSSDFSANSILDHQTGVISEPAQDGSYWINSDNGPANAYIVIDLGADYHITSFDLFNTHNAQYFDRGTGGFSIEAAHAIAAGVGGSVGSDLAGPITTLVSGTLASESGDPLSAQTYSSVAPGTFRYIRLSPNSAASSSASCCGSNVYGLNELRVFETPDGVPEPPPISLLCGGVAMIALFGRRLSPR